MRAVVQVGSDALRPGDHVSMGENDALRLAGAARGVQDGDDVGVDHPMRRDPGRRFAGVRTDERCPTLDSIGLRGGVGLMIAHDDDMAQIRAVRKHFREQSQTFRRGDQDAGIAIPKDVGHLVRFEQRVQRHEDGARRRRAEGCGDALMALLEIDADAIGACDPETHQSRGEGIDLGGQGGIGQRDAAVGQRLAERRSFSRMNQQFVQQRGITHRAIDESIEFGATHRGIEQIELSKMG